MSTYLEIHALQSLPPSNVNRDDTGAPKSATYGGVLRARVSSQSWKRAIRKDFEARLSPEDIGIRSKQIVELLMDEITTQNPELADRAQQLAVAAFTAAGFPKLAAPTKKKDEPAGVEELGYLMFLSRGQIRTLAQAAITAADEADPTKALKAAKVRDLVDRDHSLDIALFGRMVADAPDLNVDAACQVAHALGIHELTPEFDYYTAVDDRREDAEETGAGMIGTIEFNASTLYRYAAVNVDQLQENLGNQAATQRALAEFTNSFIASMPSGKQNTFANGTRPEVILVTIGSGQPVNLAGAFEEAVRPGPGYLKPGVKRLADYATDVFTTWRRPDRILVCGLSGVRDALATIPNADVVSLDELIAAAAEAGAQEPA